MPDFSRDQDIGKTADQMTDEILLAMILDELSDGQVVIES